MEFLIGVVIGGLTMAILTWFTSRYSTNRKISKLVREAEKVGDQLKKSAEKPPFVEQLLEFDEWMVKHGYESMGRTYELLYANLKQLVEEWENE